MFSLSPIGTVLKTPLSPQHTVSTDTQFLLKKNQPQISVNRVEFKYLEANEANRKSEFSELFVIWSADAFQV